MEDERAFGSLSGVLNTDFSGPKREIESSYHSRTNSRGRFINIQFRNYLNKFWVLNTHRGVICTSTEVEAGFTRAYPPRGFAYLRHSLIGTVHGVNIEQE